MHFLFKFVFVIIPPLALAWVNKWISLFSYTALTHPEWQQRADLTGAALGTIAVIAIYARYHEQAKARLAKKAILFFIVSILLALACFVCRFSLQHFASAQSFVQAIIDIWEGFYVVMLLAVVATITFVDLRWAK